MPKYNINYENSVIYKIHCKDESCKDVYVGQTTDFTRRVQAHKNCSSRKIDFLYRTIWDNGGWKNWNIEIIEKFPAKTKQEVLDREQYWINTLQANLNINIRYDPSDYKREWYFKNRERIREFKKMRKEEYNCKIDPENPPDWYLANVNSQKK
jgi:group I intron endonuclease